MKGRIMGDLFSELHTEQARKQMPLAARIRPEKLEEIAGQSHILGPGMLLRRAIESDQLGSLLFYGPPGTGKTTLAMVISHTTNAVFVPISAVSSGVAELRQVIREAEERMHLHGRGTIVFIDEIHRFNKTQQDALLPSVEEGKIVLIGATTENPYFSVNAALLSRSRIFRLEPLSEEDTMLLLKRALEDKDKGLGMYRTEVAPEALAHFAAAARGDARQAINGLELAVRSTAPGPDGIRRVDRRTAEESIQERAIVYDKTGDQHYDVASAFIKSMRGSDADAAIHYMARMLSAGEDPRFLFRRMLILASEDVGPADPMAMAVIAGAAAAYEQVGLPEGRIILANAVIYLCNAPKSNAAVVAVDKAQEDVRNGKYGAVPAHLRDSHYPGAAGFGHGLTYQYPHNFGGWVEQDYLPEEMKGTRYYIPTGIGRDTGPAMRMPEPSVKKEANEDKGEEG
ncbi:MAG: replication-associated recombination protein A [Clostridiales bacterium]|nr:replication-associated recombination protein A [Clostridiales bacterium]